MNYRKINLLSVPACLITFTIVTPSSGQVVRDGTVGSGDVTVQPRVIGNDIEVREDLGIRLGANEQLLLHSFSEFSVRDGQQVTFTGDSSISSVISRVTGDNPSTINGKLISTISGADFFLLNPRGVIFGAESSIDVNGTFSVSTADSLMFDNGESIQVYSGDSLPILTSATPESFGFLSTRQGSVVLNGGGLTNEHGGITLAGSEIFLNDGASLYTHNYSGGSSGEIELIGENGIYLSGFGDDLKGSSILNDNYQSVKGGSIRLTAPTIVLGDGADVLTQNAGQNSGATGDIFFVASQSLTLSGVDVYDSSVDTANVQTITRHDGDAGNINLDVGTLNVLDGGKIQTSSQSSGDGGDISITATESITLSGRTLREDPTTLDGALIRAGADNPAADSRSGNISLKAKTISLLDSSRISAGTTGQGDGGDVTIIASERLSLTGNNNRPILNPDAVEGDNNGSRIEVQAFEGSSGNAGSILIETAKFTLRDEAIILSNSSSAEGGDIRILADSLMSFDSDIVSSAISSDGGGGDITLSGDLLFLSDSWILAQAEEGPGGTIDVSDVTLPAILRGTSLLDASSSSGVDGSILTPTSQNSNLGDEELLTEFLDVSSLLLESCSGYVDNTELRYSSYNTVVASPEGLVPAMMTDVGKSEGGMVSQDTAVNREVAALRSAARIKLRGGDYRGSIETLDTAQNLARKLEDPYAIAVSRGELGNALIAAGKRGAARKTLTDAIKLALPLSDADLSAQLHNSLGNLFVKDNNFDLAIEAYGKSMKLLEYIDKKNKQQVLVTARVHANTARAYLLQNKVSEALDMLDAGERYLAGFTDDKDAMDINIHMGKSFEMILALTSSQKSQNLRRANNSFLHAEKPATDARDFRRLSYIYGNIGNLHRINGKPLQALSLTRQALDMAEKAKAPESMYRWHWQEAELLKEKNNLPNAIRSYRRAVSIIEGSRQSSMEMYDSEKTHFKKLVEPVYLGLIDALLEMESDTSDPSRSQVLLKEARQVLERFKTAELENYFRDECVINYAEQQKSLDSISPTTAIVYPLILDNRIEILVSRPSDSAVSGAISQINRYSVPVDAGELSRHIEQLRQYIDSISNDAGLLTESRWLYQQLVAPYIEDMRRHEIDTLVFVPSGALRLVPFAALHDGTDFIVRNFSLATASGLSLTDPVPLSKRKGGILLSGISDAVGEFEPLPSVSGELASIEQLYDGDILFNQEFTSNNFNNLVQNNDYSIIHIASHAKFTGNVEDSFLRAYDQPITLTDLDRILTTTKYRDRPLELLVLSACQTASGDEQAVMGLAGVGIRAGARSALASLWEIGDESTSELMTQFYTGLKRGQLSKAEALRQAQLALLNDDRYEHPFYWSAFVMIDNWL